jgi:hypothetical protein
LLRAFGKNGDFESFGTRAAAWCSGDRLTFLGVNLSDAVAGVGRITAIDDQDLTGTNVTRVHGSGLSDAGHPKVEIVHRHADQIGTGTKVKPVKGSRWRSAQTRRAILLQNFSGIRETGLQHPESIQF